jgi:Phytanoyl-CoA dioxygenase (PhyH)
MGSIAPGGSRFSRELFGSPGYFWGLSFSRAELDTIRAMIRGKWLARLIAARPDKADVFNALPTDRYHEACDLIDHATVWTKDSRLFSPSEVGQLQSMSLLAEIRDALGPFEIADIEGLGYPEVYWRLVRPNAPNDVAGAHTDEWFYTYTNNMSAAQQAGLVKVWIAVHVEPGTSGMAVVPDSHLRDWPHHAELRHGRPKPVLDMDQAQLGLAKLETQPGEAVVFNTRLLHAGIGHSGGKSRISMEFAIRLQ